MKSRVLERWVIPDAGVRELTIRAPEIVRDVRERRARYIITYRERPVGVLVPLEAVAQPEVTPGSQTEATAWEELTRLGEEIGRDWQSPLTAAELLPQMRR